MAFALKERSQTVGEEIANSISHGVGFVLASAALPILVVAAVRRGDTWAVVGGSIFGATMVILYLSSTLYHALPRGRAKTVFKVLDHAGIYLLIAGTYTPFTLGALRGGWGWTLLGVIWALALGGVVLEAVGRVRFPTLSTVIYLAMGWLIVIAGKPLWDNVGPVGVAWLAAGQCQSAGLVNFDRCHGKKIAKKPSMIKCLNVSGGIAAVR